MKHYHCTHISLQKASCRAASVQIVPEHKSFYETSALIYYPKWTTCGSWVTLQSALKEGRKKNP